MMLLEETLTSPSASEDGVATPGMGLCLHGSDGRRFFALPLGKSMLGSGPRCTIRLSDGGILPVQCVITRDEHGTIARSWGGTTLLNGHPFDEAAPNVGDRLTVGTLELEFVGEAEAYQPTPRNSATDGWDGPSGGRAACGHEHELARFREQIRQGRQLARLRVGRLTAAVRLEREERRRLEEQLLQKSEAHDRILQRIELLVQENERLSRDEAGAVSEAAPSVALPPTPEPDWALSESTGVDPRQDLFDWARCSEPSGGAEVSGLSWEVADGVHQDEPPSTAEEVDDLASGGTLSPDRAHHEMRVAADAIDESNVSCDVGEAPAMSHSERFTHIVESDVEQEAAVGGVAAPPQDFGMAHGRDVMGTSEHSASSSASQDEESIEEYMAKLMQRVRGEICSIGHTKAVAPAASPPESSEPREQQRYDGPLPPIESLTPIAELSDADPLQLGTGRVDQARRASAPEQPASIQALREIANETARRAIAVHATTTYRRAALTKVIVSLLAAMTGLWIMLLAPAWIDVQCLAAIVLLMIATYWSYQTIQTYLESIRAGNYRGLAEELELDVDAGVREAPLPVDFDTDQW